MKKYIVTVNGSKYEVVVEDADPNATYAPAPKAEAPKAEAPKAEAPKAAPAAAGNGENITCPMPGTIVKLPVKAGDSVKKGDLLCVFEAMKMENEILAPRDGVVNSVAVAQGATVNSGDLVLVLG
ncbi:MAG: biotin/lipoyl-binding protein [Clostridiales bacterium]|nr:biotin/lipoyl-binding protein [Candidatus Coliplasma caballi]